MDKKLLEKLHGLNPGEVLAGVIAALCEEISTLKERVEKLE